MSYIKINIGGRERGLKFTQGTNILMQDKIADMDENERKAFGLPVIIWAGLKACCIIKGERFTKTVDGKEVPATFEDVFEWYELLTEPVLLDIANLYTEVNAKKDEPGPVEDEKKNILPDTTTNLNVADSLTVS